MTRVTLYANFVVGDGGGVYNSSLSIFHADQTSFIGNGANYGGGIKNENATAFIDNSTFYGNFANTRGGGMDNGSSSTVFITNSTFWGNRNYGVANPSSSTVIHNSYIALSVNSNNCIGAFESYSVNNLSTDASCPSPSFTQVTANDIKVKRVGWVLTLLPGSVAIDTGSNYRCTTYDVFGSPRPQDGDGDDIAVCDIGSYEAPKYQIFLSILLR